MTHPLIGAWTLERFTVALENGSEISPYGHDPVGVLCYAAEGRVFAHLMAPDRAHLGCDAGLASAEKARAALASHVSCAGTWSAAGATVSHRVAIASSPDLVGAVLTRDLRLEGDRLTLSAVTKTRFGGRRGAAVLEWRRADAPAEGDPM